MNVDSLFDKLATDLVDSGVVELPGRRAEGERVLAHQGRPFAQLRVEQMAFFMPPGTAGLGDALALQNSTPAGDGRWVEVPAEDVSEWEDLARQALAGLTGG